VPEANFNVDNEEEWQEVSAAVAVTRGQKKLGLKAGEAQNQKGVRILPPRHPSGPPAPPADSEEEEGDEEGLPSFTAFMRGEEVTRTGATLDQLMTMGADRWKKGDFLDIFSLPESKTSEPALAIKGKSGVAQLPKDGEARRNFIRLITSWLGLWGWTTSKVGKKKTTYVVKSGNGDSSTFRRWLTRSRGESLMDSARQELVRIVASLIGARVTYLAKQIIDRFYTSLYLRHMLSAEEEVTFSEKHFRGMLTPTARKAFAARVLILTNPRIQDLLTGVTSEGEIYVLSSGTWADPLHHAPFRADLREGEEPTAFKNLAAYLEAREPNTGRYSEPAVYEGLAAQYREHRLLQYAI
jgi:hypothetical protein